MRANSALSSIGGAAVTSRFIQIANQQGRLARRGSNYGEAVMARIRNLADKDGIVDPAVLMTDPVLSQNPAMREFIKQNAAVIANHAMSTDRRIIAAKREEKDRRDTQLEMEKMLTAKFGHLNAPVGQNLLNQMFTTGASSATFSHLISPMLMGHETIGLQELADNATHIGTAKTIGELVNRMEYRNERGVVMDPTKNNELLTAYSGSPILKKLADKASVSEGELLRSLAGKDTEEKNAYIAQLAQGSGIDTRALMAFRDRNHKEDLIGLTKMGLGSVGTFSDLSETKSALVTFRKNQFLERAAGEELGKVNQRFSTALHGGGEGEGLLHDLSGGMQNRNMAIQAEKIMSNTYDPSQDVDGSTKRARDAFTTTMSRNLGLTKLGARDELDPDTNRMVHKDAETDDEFGARVRQHEKLKSLQQKTARAAAEAHQVRNAAGLDKPEVKAAQDLTTELQKLVKFIKDLPDQLKKLSEAVTEASSP